MSPGHSTLLHANCCPRLQGEHELCRSCLCWHHCPFSCLVFDLGSQELPWPALRITPRRTRILPGKTQEGLPVAVNPLHGPEHPTRTKCPEQGFVCFLIQLIFPRNLARPTQFPYLTNHTIDARSSVTNPTMNRQSRKQRKFPLPGFPEPHSTRLPIDRDVASGIRIVCPNATPYVTPYWHVRSYPRAHSFVSLDYFAMRECEKQTPLVYRSMMTGYFVMYIENLLS